MNEIVRNFFLKFDHITFNHVPVYFLFWKLKQEDQIMGMAYTCSLQGKG